MRETKEAVVVLAKCGKDHKTYGILTEKLAPERWRLTWAFPIKDVPAKREGYDKARIGGQIDTTDDYPGCPFCGQRCFTVCSCGHINCMIFKNGIFTCEWCGAKGEIGEYTGQAFFAGIDI